MAAARAGPAAIEPPVIEISAALSLRRRGRPIASDPAGCDVAREVADACSRWGFFQCLGHGIPDHVLADFDAAMRAFFAADRKTKDAVRRTATNSRGYFDDELTKQTRDFKECIDIGQPWPSLIDGVNQWPTGPGLEGFRGAVERHYDACRELSEGLLAVCAVGLGLAEDHFASAMRDGQGHTSYIRLNFYPKCEVPVDEQWGSGEPSKEDGFLGINKHTDAGCLTVLRQYTDEPASLQVLRDGRWHRVHPQRGALTINIGDMMQVWSNDRYVAPLHRVLATREADRYSAPFFYNPSHTATIAPAPALGPARYAPFTWGEFRMRRFEGDYADNGAEVQISDWRASRL